MGPYNDCAGVDESCGAVQPAGLSQPFLEKRASGVWKNLASIEAFAGVHCDAAVVAPEAAALLISHDKRVKHYVVDVTDNFETVSLFADRD